MKQEVERRKKEESSGTDEVLESRSAKATQEESSDGKIGRPTLDDSERTSDPAKAITGKQPKPSNVEGSL